jgi:predicted ATP-dependent endonuclease of OLD family
MSEVITRCRRGAQSRTWLPYSPTTIMLLAKASNRNTWQLSTQDQIRVMPAKREVNKLVYTNSQHTLINSLGHSATDTEERNGDARWKGRSASYKTLVNKISDSAWAKSYFRARDKLLDLINLLSLPRTTRDIGSQPKNEEEGETERRRKHYRP